MSIHQEVNFPVMPDRIYELLTDGAKFAAATDRAADIASGDGGAFSIFGG